METTVNKLEDDKREISVNLTVEEVQKEIDEAYKLAGKARIAGFRPGKAPRNILENHFGGKEYFLAQATEELVQTHTPLAIDEHDLVPLSSPDFAQMDLVEEGKPFDYSFTFEVAPSFELSSFDPIQIELPSIEATDDEIQSQIDALLSYHTSTDEEGQEEVPELTDAWVKEVLEFESVDELKGRIADAIRMERSQQIGMLREMRVSQELVKRLVGEVPEALIRQTEQDNYRELFKSLQMQRTTLDAYLEARGLTPEDFRESMHQQAADSASMALALDTWARHFDLNVTEDEVKEEFTHSGVSNPDKLYEDWRANGRLSEIRQGILRMKASEQVFDSVEVFDIGTLTPLDSGEESEEMPAQVEEKPAENEEKPAGDEEKPAESE